MKEKFNFFGFRDVCLTLIQQLTVKLQSPVRCIVQVEADQKCGKCWLQINIGFLDLPVCTVIYKENILPNQKKAEQITKNPV